jgi:Flp pilus assembly protein CpaB
MAVRTSQRGKRRAGRNQFLLGVFLICVTIIMGFSMFRGTSNPKQVEIAAPVVGGFDVIPLPVPAEYVPAGKRVRDITFRTVSFPTHQVPQGALTSLVAIQDAVTAAPLPANLPLFKDNFTQAGANLNPVVERIPPGMRAMTIRVDATSAVEGWAGSGSVVDILLIENDRTTVVAEKVKVLSSERSVAPVEGAAAPNVPNTATLLVTQEQCLAINTAIPRGRIAFALRSSQDDETWGSRSFTADGLQGVRAMPERKSLVTGYVEIKEGKADENPRSFALADGKWTKTQAVPDGFLVNKEQLEK